MSDSVEELSKLYEKNVLDHSRSIGLFPIPEYPELEAERGMWSTALGILLTSLRYLAPAVLLTLFWGQQSFLFKFVKYIDSAFRSLLFSNEEQKRTVLQWLADAGAVGMDKLEVVWRHGWIVCGMLDTALPGACAGHPPVRLSLKHAQAIAEQYLGVEPAFSHQELECNDTLGRHEEWKLVNYLDKIRLALCKITPPATKLTPQKSVSDSNQFTLDYVARGAGLTAAQVNKKAFFKIYPTAQQTFDPGAITIVIHGPKETYGMTVLSPILGKAQMIRQNLLGLQAKSTYTENILPITQGTTYLRTYGKNDMNKTFFIPKTNYDIEIESELKEDHARISYYAIYEGKYEISITSRGQNIVGSPFKVAASHNIVGILEKDNFCLEDGEEIDIVDIKNDRKVVLRIVDFVTEKMLLKENGTLEKISDEEAQYLMKTDIDNNQNEVLTSNDNKRDQNVNTTTNYSNNFYKAARKIIILNKVCKFLIDSKSKEHSVNNDSQVHIENPKNKQDIPDIVNSTFCDNNVKSQTLPKKRDRIIIPESIEVSFLTEKIPSVREEFKLENTFKTESNSHNDCFDNFDLLQEKPFEDDNLSVNTVLSLSNPFLNDAYEQNTIEKKFGSLVPSEYETNNSQSEELEKPVKLLVKKQRESDDNNQYHNPFIDSINLERPKTPVYKIITGEIEDRHDSIYVDPKSENKLNNITNPFHIYNNNNTLNICHEKPDFIIGAPVSLPPVTINSSTNTNIKTITEKELKINATQKIKESQGFKSPSPNLTLSISRSENFLKNNNFLSIDSNLSEDLHVLENKSLVSSMHTSSDSRVSESPRKDTWDSAYVSIDENNILLDNNINDGVYESSSNQRPSINELSKMGPAEREIWQLNDEYKNSFNAKEDTKTHKCEVKRSEFKPIFEENERNTKYGMKDTTNINSTEVDPVTVAFAELDDIYNDLLMSEVSSVTTTQDDKFQNLEIDYSIECNKIHVDSASGLETDVKRRAKQLEGKISVVQANVTESVSASRNLHVTAKKQIKENNKNKNEILFGDQNCSNIVLEKKRYWDERIREIDAKSEQIKLRENKRRLSCKYLRRNDSLSKRKGKKIVQNFLRSDQDETEKYTNFSMDKIDTLESENGITPIAIDNNNKRDLNLTTKIESVSCFGKKISKSKESIFDTFKQLKVSNDDVVDVGNIYEDEKSELHLKLELSEKVFQAFETSPKRFFGTSRKQILNKIDTFLGLPIHETKSEKSQCDVTHESGLVSSRITLFHNISQTEELPWARRKSKSMFNITYKDNHENVNNTDELLEKEKIKTMKQNTNDNANFDKNKNTSITLKEKRARMTLNKYNKSFDETLCSPVEKRTLDISSNSVIQDLNDTDDDLQVEIVPKAVNSISKSEMDIFNKVTSVDTDHILDKHKSYEELPRISVKSFISHYEDVSKSSNNGESNKKNDKTKSLRSQITNRLSSSISEAERKKETSTNEPTSYKQSSTKTEKYNDMDENIKNYENNKGIKSIDSANSSFDFEVISNQDKDPNYLSLSDIEIEIIEEHDVEKSIEHSRDNIETAHLDYKNRFTMAKKYFQSLEELREENKVMKVKTIKTLSSTSSESLEENATPRRKSNVKKSRSMPSSEISKIWNQMQKEDESNKKYVKISEKFNVEDLFEDVMEGRLSRQGSLRGIPHKKAVLEAFRSMENVNQNKLSSYEMAVTQLTDFANENKTRSAQTYLSEYPYLPTTDPSKYHSRLDANASGLITLKELKKRPRRNSVPDLYPSFIVEL